MTLKNTEDRSAEQVQISIPVRVLSFDLKQLETGGFCEDTRTLQVNRSGASIALRNPVAAGDCLRIINCMNFNEGDFRVVGPLGATEDGAGIWALENLERRDNFWGVESLSANPGLSEVVLRCRACGKKAKCGVTFMELEVLDFSGSIILSCVPCGKATFWTSAGRDQTVNDQPELADPAFPSQIIGGEGQAERNKAVEERSVRRSCLRLPILVRNQAGEQELSRTLDISKFGVAVALFTKLELGDKVKLICPYDPASGGIEQTAEVRWRSQYYNQDFPRTYGLRFIR